MMINLFISVKNYLVAQEMERERDIQFVPACKKKRSIEQVIVHDEMYH